MFSLNMLQRDAVLVALLVLAVLSFSALYYAMQYFKKEKISLFFARLAAFLSVFFFLYLAVLKRSGAGETAVELRLLWSYRTYITGYCGVDVFAQAIENIAIFVPIGLFMPFCMKKSLQPYKIVLCAFALSLFAELCQLVFKLGVFEIDDLINNTIGAALGVGLYCSLTAAQVQRGTKPIYGITNARRFVLGLVPLFAVYELLVMVGVLQRIFKIV